MRKPLIILLLSFGFVKAQVVTNLDCITAIFVNGNYTTQLVPNSGNGNINDLQLPNNISNPNVNPIGTNSGCMLSNELVPQWFIFKICNPGNFELLIGSDLGQCPQAGFTDWSLWKYTSTSCSKIFNNQLAPLRCNWNGAVSGGTGICDTLNLPPNGVKYNYEPPLAVNAGDSLVLCFSNFSGVNALIDFMSIGTASINCSIITSLATNESLRQKAFVYYSSLKQIKILDPSIEHIVIRDVQGKEIYKKTNEENLLIDCNNFAKGIYFVTYYSKENLPATEKILID
ncbi:MAG: T9SS type A sorting domain-containing protein [Bacteroidota bacterium]|nr:T9SS type A sorting domain-containing protein [Bacteroidota bacterium]